MLFTLLSLLLRPVLSVFGYHVRLHQIYPSIIDFSLSSSSYKITLQKITISLRLPSATTPHWAIITAYGYVYTDDKSLVRCNKTVITLWFFPVLFRRTAGTWVTTTLDGFSVHVFTSERTPRWIRLLRDDIFYSILSGETVCLHHLKTRLQFSGRTGSNNQFNQVAGPQAEGNLWPQLSLSSSQWHITNPRGRMYRYGDLELTLWRDSVNTLGSVTLLTKDSHWTVIPALAQQATYRKASKFWQFFQGLYSFPSNVIKVITDPLTTVDIVVQQCTVEFEFFRLRDAGLIRQLYTRIHQEHQNFNANYPGLLQDIILDNLLAGLCSSFGYQAEESSFTDTRHLQSSCE